MFVFPKVRGTFPSLFGWL